MKVRPSVRKICPKCKIIKRKGVLRVICDNTRRITSYNVCYTKLLRDLSMIAGQRAVITRAKKSIAAFKLREGMPVGCRVRNNFV